MRKHCDIISPIKTVIVPFTNRYKLQRIKAITLSECRTEASNEVKYLEITLDSKLSFKTHVDNTIDKCTRALFTCINIAGKSWGTSTRIIRRLYLMVVRPILTYGAIVWCDRAPLRRNSISCREWPVYA